MVDQGDRCGLEVLPNLRRQPRGRRLFDQLLVAALDRAVPLWEGDPGTRGVGEHLHLDVPEPLEVLLHVDRAVAEARPGLPTRLKVGVLHPRPFMHHAHPLAPAPGARLDNQRVADLRPDAPHFRDALAGTVGAGGYGDASLYGGLASLGLVAHARDHARGRANEPQLHPLADLGEAGVLGVEAVAGVDRVGAGELGGGDDRGYVEVAAAGGRRADADGLVGKHPVQRVGVGRGVDRDAPYLELAAGPDDAQGDLAPVSYQNLADHWRTLLFGSEVEERLVVLDALGVLGQDLHDLARDVGRNFVHQLHRLDDAQDLASLDPVPHLDVGFLAGRRCPVEGSDQWRADRVQPVPLRRRRPLDLSGVLPVKRACRRGGVRFGSGLHRDLDVPLADPDLADPAPAHEVHELLDLLERQRSPPRLVLRHLVHALHSLGFYTSARGKVRPRLYNALRFP